MENIEVDHQYLAVGYPMSIKFEDTTDPQITEERQDTVGVKKRPRTYFTGDDDQLMLNLVVKENPFTDHRKWLKVALKLKQERSKNFTPRNVRERVTHLQKLFHDEKLKPRSRQTLTELERKIQASIEMKKNARKKISSRLGKLTEPTPSDTDLDEEPREGTDVAHVEEEHGYTVKIANNDNEVVKEDEMDPELGFMTGDSVASPTQPSASLPTPTPPATSSGPALPATLSGPAPLATLSGPAPLATLSGPALPATFLGPAPPATFLGPAPPAILSDPVSPAASSVPVTLRPLLPKPPLVTIPTHLPQNGMKFRVLTLTNNSVDAQSVMDKLKDEREYKSQALALEMMRAENEKRRLIADEAKAKMEYELQIKRMKLKEQQLELMKQCLAQQQSLTDTMLVMLGNLADQDSGSSDE